MTEKIKVVELKDMQSVKFVPKTYRLGRAEFEICAVWKYGKIREIWIVPTHQKNKVRYHIGNLRSTALSIQSWTHKGLENPWIWRSWYCKEHKTISMSVYPPDGTNSFQINVCSTISITFEARTK